MKTIEYRITYNDGGGEEFATVQARTINSGFGKALRFAKERLGNGHQREICKIEFWQVKF